MDKKIKMIQSSKGRKLFEEAEPISFYADEKEEENELLCIYEGVQYQEVEGFGGALTESVAHNLCRMKPENKERVLRAYFDSEQGLGFRFCRTNIGSCDFSTEIYSYDDTPEDYELKDFSVEHDERELIPMLKEALKIAPDMKILASPWSPPAWMKTNHNMELGGSLKPQCRQAWADYIVKYLKAYEKEEIKIWGVTVQNEAKASQTWESCVYTATEEKEFVRDYLGPAFEKGGQKEVKILIWDHNKERVVERVKEAMEDPEAANYIYGAAVHWYSGDHFDALQVVHDEYPEFHLYSTENSMGRYPKHFWEMGEKIAHGIIGEMRHGINGWFAWNLILDEYGLPNHDHPIGKSPMMVDYGAGESLYYDSAYYYIGHFSKFIRPKARRIASSIYTDKLETVSFCNPDGEIVTVVLNRTEEPQKWILKCKHGLADFVSEPRSIMTVCYES